MSWFYHSREKEDRLMGKDTDELRERVEKLEKRMRSMDEEWTEVYNRFRTLQMRVAKQVQRLDEHSSHEAGQEAQSGAAAPPVNTGATLSSLSPRAQLIQKQILERRALMSKDGGEK
jgi:DNA anti-recombination protein RmuC